MERSELLGETTYVFLKCFFLLKEFSLHDFPIEWLHLSIHCRSQGITLLRDILSLVLPIEGDSLVFLQWISSLVSSY